MSRPGHVVLFRIDVEPDELLNKRIALMRKVHHSKAAGLELGSCLYNLYH